MPSSSLGLLLGFHCVFSVTGKSGLTYSGVGDAKDLRL